MKNKQLTIRLAILAVAVLIIILLTKDCNGSKTTHGNKWVVTTTDTTSNDNTDIKDIKKIFLMMDNSGSMKGYLDFREYPEANRSMISPVTTPLNELVKNGAKLNVKYRLKGNFTATEVGSLLKNMNTLAAFQGKESMLNDMIKDVYQQASDTTISILVSDMVLSYGRERVRLLGDPWYNKHHLPDLGAGIHTVLSDHKDIDILMLQYYSDFNGRYYCNCKEERPFVGLMKDRPYYLMVFGQKGTLKSLLENDVFETPINIYASFDLDNSDMRERPMTIEANKGDNVWTVDNSSEDPDGKTEGTIWTNSDFEGTTSNVTVKFNKFEIPKFLSQEYEIGDYHLSNVIQNVEETTDTSNPNLLSFKITLKPFNQLPDQDTVEFTLNSKNDWGKEATVDNDDDVNIDSIQMLEKKTWGLNTIIENLNKAYFGANQTKRQPQVVARIKFNMSKY